MTSFDQIKDDLLEFFGNTIDEVRSELKGLIGIICIILFAINIILFYINYQKIESLKTQIDLQKIKTDKIEVKLEILESKFSKWKYLQEQAQIQK